MENEKLSKILKLHEKWLNGESGGEKAILRGDDLSRINFRGTRF